MAKLISMQTPYMLGSRTRRLQARLWDWLYCWTPGLVGYLGFGVLFISQDSPSNAWFLIPLLGVLLSLALSLLNLIHFARTGQSWGKKRMGLLVINVNGDRMSGGGLVWRSLSPFLVTMVPLVGLVMYFDNLFIFSESRRCLHDHFASTQVVDANSYKEPASQGTGLNPSEIGFSKFE